MASVRLPLARAAWLGLVYAGLLLASTPGCNSIRVHRAGAGDSFPGWRFTALRDGDLSPRTRQTLRQWDLEDAYARNPDEAIARLHEQACRDPQPDLLFALAEVHFVRGRQTEHHDPSAAARSYYLCAGYAYHYLFGPRAGPDTVAGTPTTGIVFDPRFRLACDLYNAGLSRCLATAQRAGQLDPRKELHVPAGDGRDVVLSVSHSGFTWKDEEFGPLLFCDDFEVRGLANHYRTYGLGVPLIATRSPEAPPNRYFPATASFAATAFLRFNGSLADLGAHGSGRLELYDPLATRTVDVAGKRVPLETDLTTPLAHFLAQSDLDEIGIKGFLNADKIRGRTGINMLAPYQPGKVPVVLVHGLLSSPMTWAPVFNDLQADPVLRERCQFWYYFYPTGEPYLVAAAKLRDELARIRHDLDPKGQDAALGQMVFVGHSMGGLVSKLLTVEGGDDFWRLVSDEPLSHLKLKTDTRAELQETFYFRREPCVSRVVFLATPHHGSRLSPTALGRLAVKLASLPRDLMDAAKDVAAENPELADVFEHKPLPTSVDLLAPDSPALELLAARPRPERVHYHSIIGKLPPAQTPLETWLSGDREPGDGVVPYASAHLEGADSELVVPADHFHVHHHPLAVREVRRILLEHTEELARKRGVVPAAHTTAADPPK
jgi:pimeloyl-ACP methyl ester carboxylesterase